MFVGNPALQCKDASIGTQQCMCKCNFGYLWFCTVVKDANGAPLLIILLFSSFFCPCVVYSHRYGNLITRSKKSLKCGPIHTCSTLEVAWCNLLKNILDVKEWMEDSLAGLTLYIQRRKFCCTFIVSHPCGRQFWTVMIFFLESWTAFVYLSEDQLEAIAGAIHVQTSMHQHTSAGIYLTFSYSTGTQPSSVVVV